MMPNFLYIIWDIDPEIISSPISLRYYGLCFATAFVLGYYVLQQIFKNDKVPVEWLDSVLMYVIIGTVAGARLGHCFLYDWDYFQHHILEIFLPVRFEPEFEFIGYRGLASHGAAVGIIFSAWLWSKRISKKTLLWILDRVVITVALGGFFIRFGNLMNSEIVGLQTDVPWAFVFKQLDDIPRHPTQLYEAFSYLAIFGVLYYLHFYKKLYLQTGRIFGIFLVALFGVRLILEQLKENQSAFEESMYLNMGQLLSVPFILLGIYLIIRKVKSH